MSTQPNTTDLDRQRAEFEAQLPESLSREMQKDDEGDLTYVDDLTQGAWIGWQMALARRSQPVAASSIKTWQERCAEKYPTITGGALAPWAKLQCAIAEIADLRAALAATQQAAEPVAKVSPSELRDIQSGLMAVPVRSNNWRDDQTIPLYLAAPVAQQSEAGAPASNQRARFDAWFKKYMGLHPETDTTNRSDAFDLWKAWEAASQPTEAGAPTASATGCGTFACRAAQKDGIVCADGECDIESGMRAAPTSGRESAAPVAKQDASLEHLKAAREAVRRVMADLSVLHEDKPEEMAATIALTATLVSGDLELAANSIDAAMRKGAEQ